MPAANSVKSRDCPDCGARLSQGVCPACALDFLNVPATTQTVSVKGGDLDIEFGDYLLKRKLATGGMGVVYAAEDTKLKRQVALKMIRGSTFANESERARFTVESEAVAGLDHPNIVPIHEVGVIEEQPFFTMKLIEGGSLGERLRGGEASVRQIVEWLRQIAIAVQHAHQRGVLHRDLKPGNVLVDDAGNAWLMDFGLAKLQGEESGLTRSSDHLGTPHYMSPEAVNGGGGDVSTASDVWSLGVMLWEAISGALPFTGSGAVEIMQKIVTEEPARPEVTGDRDLITLARRCLEKAPERRISSAGEFAEELGRWLRGEPLRARRITAGERLVKWVRRKPAIAALYLVLACGVASSLVLWRHAEGAVDELSDSNQQLMQALAISKATKLAMEARVSVAEDPVPALLLAVEAVDQTTRLGRGALPDASDALHAVLQQVGGRDISPLGVPEKPPVEAYISHGLTDAVQVIYSNDHRRVLTVSHAAFGAGKGDGVCAAISSLDGEDNEEPLRYWKIWEETTYDSPAVSWVSEQNALVAIDDAGMLRLWDTAPREPTVTAEKSIATEGHAIAKTSLLVSRGRTEVRGVTVFRKPDHTGAGVRAFVVDLQTGGIKLGALQPGHPTWIEKTRFRVDPNLRWIFAAGSGVMTLTRLDGNGVLGETGEFEVEYGEEFHWDFCESGDWLMLARDDAALAIDLRSGRAESAAASARLLVETGESANRLAVSPTESLVAIANRGSVVHVVDLDGDRPVRFLRTPDVFSRSLNFSADGKWVAVGGDDRVVRVWEVARLAESPAPLEFRGMSSAVLDVSFSPDGKYLVAEGLESTFRRWEFGGTAGGAQPSRVGTRSGIVGDVACSPDGGWLACASEMTGHVRVVGTAGQGELTLGLHVGDATGVAFSPGGEWLASAGRDGFVRVWEMDRVVAAVSAGGDRPAPSHEFDISHDRLEYNRRLAFHPRGSLYVTCGDGILYEWDLNSAEAASTVQAYPVHSMRYLLPDVRVSPDGKLLAVARHGWDSAPVEGATQFFNMVLLFDVSKPGPPVPVGELPSTFNNTTNLDFSPDSRWLAAGGAGKGPRIWDLQSRDIADSAIDAEFSSQRLSGIEFCPGGKCLAAAGSDGRIHLWDWRNDSATRTIVSGKELRSLAWIDATRFATGGVTGRLEIWESDVKKLQELARKVAGRELTGAERRRVAGR